VGKGADEKRSSALVAFSGAWVTSNYEDMVGLLRYFPASDYLDSLRNSTPENRSERWRAFYHGTDPNPATPTNEMLDQYFARVALANQRFTDEGVAGWRTDRGEVLIRIGRAGRGLRRESPERPDHPLGHSSTSSRSSSATTPDSAALKLTQAPVPTLERIAAGCREAG
jgi:GWxTD domain-containing protein